MSTCRKIEVCSSTNDALASSPKYQRKEKSACKKTCRIRIPRRSSNRRYWSGITLATAFDILKDLGETGGVCAERCLMGETGGQSGRVAKIERAEAFDVPKAVMDGTDAVMLSASTPGEPSIDNLKEQRHLHGISEWFQAKGPFFYANWELEPPRDNYDITTAVPATALTEQEQALNDAERLGAHRRWKKQVLMYANRAERSWRMQKRFIFHCCFMNQYKEITLLELKALVDSCFPLIRDRRFVMKRAQNLSLSNSRILRLTNKVLAELVDRSENQVVNYKRQIKDELGVVLWPLSQDPARYL